MSGQSYGSNSQQGKGGQGYGQYPGQVPQNMNPYFGGSYYSMGGTNRNGFGGPSATPDNFRNYTGGGFNSSTLPYYPGGGFNFSQFNMPQNGSVQGNVGFQRNTNTYAPSGNNPFGRNTAGNTGNPFAAGGQNTVNSNFGPTPPSGNVDPNSQEYASYYWSLPASTRAYMTAPGSAMADYRYQDQLNNSGQYFA